MQIDTATACRLLAEQDHIVILSHARPDGDTMGSSFALLYALLQLGKTARVESPDGFPRRYGYLYGDYRPMEFQAAFVVAADVASAGLLGSLEEVYRDRVDLCVDHHGSNTGYARKTLLDSGAAACAQVVYEVVKGLGVRPEQRIANSIFTGLSTDTGCFRFANVTAQTHRVAGEMIAWGAEHAMINKRMFLTKSRGRVQVEQLIVQRMEYHYGGRCALVMLPGDVRERYGADEEDLDGIASFPCTIEGVQAGVTVRDQGDGSYRVSLRTEGKVNASRICARFGGGGHRNAGGCTVSGEPGQVRERLLAAVGEELEA